MPDPTYDWLQRVWYGGARSGVVLMPLSWLFRLAVSLRRALYGMAVLPSYAVGKPVVVVGNISVGGTGKTPLTIALAARLAARGLRVGVASRGYAGAGGPPRIVRADSDARDVGDEPLLIAQSGHAVVAVSADRVAAARLLVEQGCDVILADDGLQHLRLRRDVEIAVVDGERSLGNGRLLPAGPLREHARRLRTVDAIVVNGGPPPTAIAGHEPMAAGGGSVVRMSLEATETLPLVPGGVARPLENFAGQRVHALAAIGNPQRFFALLRRHGIEPVEHPLPDHAPLDATALRFDDDLPVLMTEKDAVKCRRASAIADRRHWVVRVAPVFESGGLERLERLVLDRIAGAGAADPAQVR